MDLTLFSVGFVALLGFALWLATRITDIEETSLVRAIVSAVILGIVTLIVRAFIDSAVYWIILDLVLFIVIIKIVYRAQMRDVAMIWFWTWGIFWMGAIILSFIARAMASKPGG